MTAGVGVLLLASLVVTQNRYGRHFYSTTCDPQFSLFGRLIVLIRGRDCCWCMLLFLQALLPAEVDRKSALRFHVTRMVCSFGVLDDTMISVAMRDLPQFGTVA